MRRKKPIRARTRVSPSSVTAPGDPAGLEGGQAGGVAGGMVGGAIALPEDGVAPVPAKSNIIPDYPQEARAAGKTGHRDPQIVHPRRRLGRTGDGDARG